MREVGATNSPFEFTVGESVAPTIERPPSIHFLHTKNLNL
jgi:hypothetical protein